MKALMKASCGGLAMWKVWRDRIAKRVYVGEFACSHSVGRPQKRRIDTVKECLKKRGLDVREARGMVQDRTEWRPFAKGRVHRV